MKPIDTNPNIKHDHTSIGKAFLLTAFAELAIAVMISTRRSTIICGVNALIVNTIAANTAPTTVPTPKNGSNS